MNSPLQKRPLRIVPFVGANASPFINDVAKLRLEVFNEFPYLYVGDMDYERRYLSTYTSDPESLVVIAFDEDGKVPWCVNWRPHGSRRR